MQKLLEIYQRIKKDRFLLIEVFLCFNLIRLGLLLLPFAQLSKLLTKLQNKSVNKDFLVNNNHARTDITRVVNAILTCDRYSLIPAKCLAKALTTRLLLARRGYCCLLHIGVAKTPKKNLEAHAWVEHNAEIVMGNLPNINKFVLITNL